MLHPGVGRDDEIAAQPRTQKNTEGGEPMKPGAKPLFSVYEKTEKRRFQEKRKHSLHGQGLPDDAARGLRKSRPIRAELKLHGDTGHHTHRKVNGEDPGPKASGAVVMLA